MKFPEPGLRHKISSVAELRQALAQLPRPLVFTNGCFDLLHRGHVTYLQEARRLGASMVVGVNSDESVRRLGKGEDRPVNGLDDRMEVLAALAAVDRVVPFDDDTPLQLILACRPDVLVKGGDWTTERIVGASEVEAWGGRVYSIPFRHQRSTTELVLRMRSGTPGLASGRRGDGPL